MKKYLSLLRVKHYIKNLLIFLPMFFNVSFFDREKLISAVMGFISFSAAASAIYIFNDLKDVEKDRLHPRKKDRPLASGEIKKGEAVTLMIISIIISISLLVLSCFLVKSSIYAVLILAVYLIINIFYSAGLKNRPIIDVVILAAGFVLRVYFGGFMTDVYISKWLMLVITMGSLYMGLGKRRNELVYKPESREVLKYYNTSFLENNMYVCMVLSVVFYAMWTVEMNKDMMIWTIPMILIILMKYSLDIEGDHDGDPVEVLMKDKVLILLVLLVFIAMFYLLYIS